MSTIWLLVALAVVIGLPLAALRFGADSRDGCDWKPISGLPEVLSDRELVSSPASGARHARTT